MQTCCICLVSFWTSVQLATTCIWAVWPLQLWCLAQGSRRLWDDKRLSFPLVLVGDRFAICCSHWCSSPTERAWSGVFWLPVWPVCFWGGILCAQAHGHNVRTRWHGFCSAALWTCVVNSAYSEQSNSGKWGQPSSLRAHTGTASAWLQVLPLALQMRQCNNALQGQESVITQDFMFRVKWGYMSATQTFARTSYIYFLQSAV